MQRPLVPCPACARHVRLLESPALERCPFCASALGAFDPSPPAAPHDPAARLSRAALFAIGAATALAGCNGALTPPPPPSMTAQPPAAPSADPTPTPTPPPPRLPSAMNTRYGAPPAPPFDDLV